MAEQPIAPHADRQQQRQRAQAQKLHHQIGGDRAGHAQEIMHRRIGGMAERRVLHRPGGERQGRQQREADQRDAADLAEAPLQSDAQLAGESGHAVETAVDHRHRELPRDSASGPPLIPAQAGIQVSSLFTAE